MSYWARKGVWMRINVYVELVRKLLSDDADVEEFAEMVLLVEPLSLRRQRPAKRFAEER